MPKDIIQPTPEDASSEGLRASWRRDRRFAWLIWALFALGIAASIVFKDDPSARSVTPEYHRAAMLWWRGEGMYTDGVHGFLYLPQAAMVYSAFAWLPAVGEEILWRLAGLGLLAWGLRLLTGTLFGSRWPAAFLMASGLSVVSALGSAANGQTNVHLAGLFALGCADMIGKRWWRLALWLMLALALKPTAVVMILLVGAIYPRPMWWRLGVAVAVLALLPFAHPSPGYVGGQYRDCLVKMSAASEPGDQFQDIRGLLMEVGLVHVEKIVATPGNPARFVQSPPEVVLTLVRGVAALATLGLCFVASRRFGDIGRGMMVYTLGAIYLTLFNPRTEGLSYVLLGVPGALWAVRELWDRRWGAAAFFMFFVLSTQLSTQIALNHKNYWVRPLGAAVFAAIVIVEIIRPRSRWDQFAPATTPPSNG